MLFALEELKRGIHNGFGPGVDDAALDRAEQQLGFTLLPDVRDLYRAVNGIRLDDREEELLTLDDAVAMAHDLASSYRREFALFPVVDLNRTYNPFCVLCDSPLRGRVVHIRHNIFPNELKYRSLRTLIRTMADIFWHRCSRLDELTSEYLSEVRLAEDTAAGLDTLRIVSQWPLDQDDHHDPVMWGLTLLSGAELPTILEWLEKGDEYDRGHVVDRLRAIGSPEAIAALSRYQVDLDLFARQCYGILRDAGLKVDLRDDGLCVGPKAVGLNMSQLYTMRKRPDFEPWLVTIGRRITEKRR